METAHQERGTRAAQQRQRRTERQRERRERERICGYCRRPAADGGQTWASSTGPAVGPVGAGWHGDWAGRWDAERPCGDCISEAAAEAEARRSKGGMLRRIFRG